MTTPSDIGPIGRQSPEDVVRAAALVRQGRMISMAAVRYPGMPLFPGHPPFQVLNYRTPRGHPGHRGEALGAGQRRRARVHGRVRHGNLALRCPHRRAGPHDGRRRHALVRRAATPTSTSRTSARRTSTRPTLPPFFTRGVLLDAAGHRGVACLPKGSPIDAAELEAISAAEGVDVRAGDVVAIRTGYMGLWPDAEAMAAHKTPGPDISAAHWLLERGVVATGTDTETYEVQPAPDPGPSGNPQPVHTLLLIQNGIYLMESLDLEALARERVYEFLFVALPLKIRGATGSMVDPVAII